MGDADGTCDSCGGPGSLEPVHRLYVVPETWDTEGSVTQVAEVEHWCFSCRSMYPHVAPGGD
jgi:hypothetical protein